ncbi:TetR/AcrR family transcriptional regulator [Arthrobacter sp. zg-Y820]|uniref:TetR/AcrR family transcriptional regulator n=1 Tax=unclassified Arthrobacter TaxID=235627 RepID=UPI001E5D1A73|nr:MULTISPECIES: TetR/AcrR family transcriptional regulator [unclassified Arthrobacter]MCC9197188.1 TetR/AcrR family transcriptional regulator [Arthrobacter sp. zg-Y820]MDK1280053.1 TetR/AcrR family transcriptional regulator [Arthrobacter sp. zg.Y820]MDK1360809.1 TetR/AcrR family transcriptional regulator [Arthrobacter sp. zg-Y1219]WIB09347.1 TetR/AcrR family transcriptional regulator [Arthrobacter sp. zg-Y820]
MPEHISTRDRILSAYEELLINEGPRGATMDAVVALAGVSKGGLLYHFKNKEALAAALIARLEELAAADIEAMGTDPEGPSRYLVRESVYVDSALDRALIGVVRLAQASDPEASAMLERIHRNWMQLILEEVGNPAIARAILLLGDGLYYNEGLAGGWPREKGAATTESVAELLEVVEVLKAHAASLQHSR